MRHLARMIRRATWWALLAWLTAAALAVRVTVTLIWHHALFTVGVALAGYVVWYELRGDRHERT